MIVTSKNTVRCHNFAFVTDASQLRFDVDMRKWPKVLETTLGNGQDFYLTEVDAPYVFIYKQIHGIIELHVFND